MSEPPSEVYFRFASEVEDIFSYGSQHPQNVKFRQSLSRAAKEKGFALMRLEEVCKLREESIDPTLQPEQPFDYLGLADIEPNTGRVKLYERMLGRDILSKSSVFYKGDIVFGRLRPYLNKVHLVEREKAIGSGELNVTIPDESKVKPEFLVRYLLSDLTLTQTKWILTGNSYPRLSDQDFRNLSIVVPDVHSDVQEDIVRETMRIEAQASADATKAAALVSEAYGTIPKRLSIQVPQMHDYDYYVVPMDDFRDRFRKSWSESRG